MVVYCCVKNCKNDWIPNSNLTFHRFPWSNPSLLNAWVNVMPLRNNNINKSSRICSDHFTENDYENNGRIYRRLKKNAVPQIFPCYDLSNALSDSSHDNVTNNSTQNILTNLSPLCEGSQHSLTPLTNNILHEHSNDSSSAKNMETLNTDEQRTESTNNKILEEKETSYRRRIKTLQRRLQRNHQKLEKMSNVIKLLRSEGNCTEKLEKELQKRFSNEVLELFLNLKNNQDKPKKGYRYTEKMKEFANTIYFYSPQAYKSLQKKLCLPDKTTLQKCINATSLADGSTLQCSTQSTAN
ncbi:THAP domain-containing protein 1 [Aphidius gifuensis]|uniref:THAP domain-containing protein 1 n=1 Tax=Aphidius gifuensis TaxID=684658 RepID=UPI001CDC31E0|nr:THAP domain-containing protein 1 [Aphidius gifuensis]